MLGAVLVLVAVPVAVVVVRVPVAAVAAAVAAAWRMELDDGLYCPQSAASRIVRSVVWLNRP